MNTPLPSSSPSSDLQTTTRATELRQQRDAFAALLEDTTIGLDAVHIRTLQDWRDESLRELAQIEPDTCHQ